MSAVGHNVKDIERAMAQEEKADTKQFKVRGLEAIIGSSLSQEGFIAGSRKGV